MSITHFKRQRMRLGTLLIGAALALTYIAGEVGDEAASAASGAEVTEAPNEVTAAASGLRVLPTNGSTNGVPMTLEIPAACPEAADGFIVEATGGGFPTGSFMLGLTAIEPGQTSFNAGGDWKAIAGNNGGTLPLSGTTNLRFVCLTGQSPAGAEYTTTVAFTPTTGTDSTFQAAAAGETPTPTPAGGGTPSATPGPSPTSTPTPTPSATPSSSPSPTPVDGDPTPTPDPDSSVDTDGNDGNDGNDGAENEGEDTAAEGLPDSGGNDPTPMILLAAMLAALGIALLLLEAASRLPEGSE